MNRAERRRRARLDNADIRKGRPIPIDWQAWCPGDDDHPPHQLDQAPLCPCCGDPMVPDLDGFR
jgi:hypothetical protein